ncbi:hypothetical protein TNCT_617611 [Trichonephila clavata]|uniref:Uncharacterized protein n=1 Tax=Trichonephila clavata TaxID=2740835 RepID=A0A8X6JAN6_TRICU|nr:hypothetical protein TNCT_617611 [Trichonephila clavata]
MVCRIEHNYSSNLSPFDVLKQFSWYNEKVASLQGNDEGTTLVLIVRFVHIHHTMKLSHKTQLWKIALRPGTSTYLNPKMMSFIAVAGKRVAFLTYLHRARILKNKRKFN